MAEARPKSNYTPPQLFEYGDLEVLTSATGNGNVADNGSSPIYLS